MSVSSLSSNSSPILSPTAPAPAAPAPAAPMPTNEPRYDRVHAANTRLPDLSRMVMHQPAGSQAVAVAATHSAARAQLDALESELAGPFAISGQPGSVSAPPTFHSNFSRKEQLAASPKLLAFAQRACGGALQRALHNACMGRPTARELVQVTQALIGAGALGDKSPIGAQDIRDLQAKFCIGIDCIGFVRLSQEALHGSGVWKGTQRHDGCTSYLDGAHGYARRHGGLAGIGSAQPGDVVHLEPSKNTENRQHNMVVRRNEVLEASDPRCHAIAERGGAALLEGGPLRLVELISSGGGEDAIRGVRREKWLYNESTKTFARANQNPLQLVFALDGHERGSVFTRRDGVR